MGKGRYTVIDLFCGCGGMSLGFEKVGYDILLGIDIWKDALMTFKSNHANSQVLNADIATLQAETVEDIVGTKAVDVIIGGPPCQGFSVAGKRIVDDERNKLYQGFVRMVAHFMPRAFVMENVPNILTIGGGIIKDAIMVDFKSLGYHVGTKVLTASDYGVPQNRRRAVFVGTLNGIFDFDIPIVSHRVTAKEAICDLPEGSLPDGSSYPSGSQSDYQTIMRDGSTGVWNHEVTAHNERTKEIISLVPDGGNYKDLPQELRATRNVHIAWTRLCSSRPSFTIDTGHRHHFHYKWNRVPTVRECARIQSFPDNFVFLCSRTSQYKQVGNAVPPLMAYAIAEQLKKVL